MTWNDIREIHPDLPDSPNGWHQHPNGGGWVRDNITICSDVFFGPKCVALGGTFKGGWFYGGWFNGGTFNGGTFYGGTFNGGTFNGGTFNGGTFKGGWFYGGWFNGGTFYDGTFYDGTFKGGLWRRGPMCIYGATRFSICEVGPDELQIGCERGKISEIDALLPQWFKKHNTHPSQQRLYIAACKLIADVAVESPIAEG